MYDRKSWGGPIDPFIHIKFLDQPKKEGKDPVASFLIFEWKDKGLVEIDGPNGFKVNIYARVGAIRLDIC